MRSPFSLCVCLIEKIISPETNGADTLPVTKNAPDHLPATLDLYGHLLLYAHHHSLMTGLLQLRSIDDEINTNCGPFLHTYSVTKEVNACLLILPRTPIGYARKH